MVALEIIKLEVGIHIELQNLRKISFFKSLSIEWARRFPKATITLLHPGTVDTDLSRPFHKFVPEHKLFSKEKSSQFLINIIKNQSPESTGKFIAWDNSEIPW